MSNYYNDGDDESEHDREGSGDDDANVLLLFRQRRPQRPAFLIVGRRDLPGSQTPARRQRQGECGGVERCGVATFLCGLGRRRHFPQCSARALSGLSEGLSWSSLEPRYEGLWGAITTFPKRQPFATNVIVATDPWPARRDAR